MKMRVSQFALGFCTSIVFMTTLRWFIESWGSASINDEEKPVKIKIYKESDRPPELASISSSDTQSPVVVLNTGSRNRLVQIEERQDKVKAAGEKRLANLELIQQMNRDPLPVTSAFGTKNIDHLCQKNDSTRCLPKFRNLESRMRTASQYKLAFCAIQKSMSTVLAASMCYLHNESNFIAAGRLFRHEYSNDRLCLHQNEYKSVEDAIGNDTDWTLLTAVREPVDRFLSGYVDKCIRSPVRVNYCNNCWANITCFILSEYSRFMNQSKLDRLPNSFEDRHFAPQNWHCHMEKYLDEFEIIRYSGASEAGVLSFGKQFFRILHLNGVPDQSMAFIRFQMEGERTIHSTIESKARQFFEQRLRSSPYLMEYVLRMFYHDFELFGFEMPKLEFPE